MSTSLSPDEINVVRNGRRIPAPQADDACDDNVDRHTDDNRNDDECWDG